MQRKRKLETSYQHTLTQLLKLEKDKAALIDTQEKRLQTLASLREKVSVFKAILLEKNNIISQKIQASILDAESPVDIKVELNECMNINNTIADDVFMIHRHEMENLAEAKRILSLEDQITLLKKHQEELQQKAQKTAVQNLPVRPRSVTPAFNVSQYLTEGKLNINKLNEYFNLPPSQAQSQTQSAEINPQHEDQSLDSVTVPSANSVIDGPHDNTLVKQPFISQDPVFGDNWSQLFTMLPDDLRQSELFNEWNDMGNSENQAAPTNQANQEPENDDHIFNRLTK